MTQPAMPYLLHKTTIRTLYAATDARTRFHGREWYEREHAYAARLAQQADHSVRIISACLSILSPRCRWPRVKFACEELLSGRRPAGILRHNLQKAEEAFRSRTVQIDPRRAPKTWAFWQNLWHPNDPEPVTLDSWMLRAHGLAGSVRLGTYEALAEAYRSVAAELHLIPNQLQAIIWLGIRQKLSNKRRNIP